MVKVITVPGSSAMDEMRRLLAQRAITGLHPTLFGKREAADAIASDFSQATDLKKVRRVIAKSQKYDLPREFARFFEPDELDETELEERRAEEEWVMGESGESAAEKNQEDAGEDEEAVLYTCMDGEELLETTYIGLWQIAEPWQAFAYLGLGEDSDQIIGGVKHCALHRHWQERWGAEVVALQENMVECFVARPPLTRADALILAREQYFYCGALVHQGAGSVVELAEILFGRKRWYFWWGGFRLLAHKF